MRTAKENRRYHLHRKISKTEFRFQAARKTVFIPYDHELQNPDIIDLRDIYHYNIQYELPKS